MQDLIKLTWGYTPSVIKTFVLTRQVAKEIWDRSGTANHANGIWIIEEPSKEEKEKFINYA